MGGLFLGPNSAGLQLLLLEFVRLATCLMLVRIKDVVLIVVALVRRLVFLELVLLTREVVHIDVTPTAAHHNSK